MPPRGADAPRQVRCEPSSPGPGWGCRARATRFTLCRGAGREGAHWCAFCACLSPPNVFLITNVNSAPTLFKVRRGHISVQAVSSFKEQGHLMTLAEAKWHRPLSSSVFPQLSRVPPPAVPGGPTPAIDNVPEAPGPRVCEPRLEAASGGGLLGPTDHQTTTRSFWLACSGPRLPVPGGTDGPEAGSGRTGRH